MLEAYIVSALWIAIPVVWLIAIIVLLALFFRGRRLAILGVILLVAPVAWIAWLIFRPDMYLNPVDRFFMTRCDDRTLQDPQSLIPDVFMIGASRPEVARALQQAGYAENTARDAGTNELWFDKEGPFAIVCGNTFRVGATFGAAGLEQALAYREATCL
jgi:hypothetical protein